MSTIRINKSTILNLIEEGVTKDKRNPNYTEEKGTFITRLKISSKAVSYLFANNKELEKAYKAKHAKVNNIAQFVELIDDELENQLELNLDDQSNIDINNLDLTIPAVSNKDLEAMGHKLPSDFTTVVSKEDYNAIYGDMNIPALSQEDIEAIESNVEPVLSEYSI